MYNYNFLKFKSMSKKSNIIPFTYILPVFTLIISIVSFFGFDNSVNLVQSHPKATLIVTYIFLTVIGFLIGYLIDLLQTIKQDDNISYNQVLKKPSILIFDDKAKCLRDIQGVTSGLHYDVVMVRDISDYRLVENFDIIIGDVYNVGNLDAKTSIPVLQSIKENYPYKIVIAMSEAPDSNWKDSLDGFISKEDRDAYPNQILEVIKSSIERLRNESYWKEVEGELSRKNISTENRKKFQDQYYTYIKKRNQI